jgi:hypothetical protein
MKIKMILRSSLMVFTFAFLFAGCLLKEESQIPDDQAKIIRQILRANGISIGDKDWVDGYVYIDPYYHDMDHLPNGTYYILLPQQGKNSFVLTDNITTLTNLTDKFKGIMSPNDTSSSLTDTGTANTFVVTTNSVIKMRELNMMLNKFKTLPPDIRYLRVNSLGFKYNQITHLPSEIMQITAPPVLYDTVTIYLEHNKLDTCSTSDSLKNWLSAHEFWGSWWWQGQNPDSCHP